MGMDILGNAPKNSKGEYFRASIWAWHPIVAILEQTCSDFLTESFFEDISINCGFGASEKQSKKIAARLIQYLEHNVDGKKLSTEETTPIASAMSGLVQNIEQSLGVTQILPSTDSPFLVHDQMLAEFVEFLSNCGGFSVH